LIIPLGVYLFQNRRWAEWLVLALAASVLIASLYGIGEHILGYDIINNRALNRLDEQTIRLSGFFSHPLTFGNYIVTASLFLTGYVLTCARDLNRRHRFFLLSAAVLGVAACALANSRGPLLALGIGLLAVGIILRKIKYVIAVLAMVIMLGFTVSPTIVQRFKERFRVDTHLRFEGGRLFVWYHSLQVVGEHPLMGVGQGNFQKAYTTHLRPDIGEHRKYTHAHNDVLTFAAISGIPGAVLYLTIWVLVIPRFWRAYRNSDNSTHARALSLAAFLASIAFFTSSLTEASFADEEVRQMLMLSWAAGLSVWYNKTDTKPEFRDKEINSLTS